MCFIERETWNFVLKFRGIFQWRETVLRAHRMKSDEKLFFCQIYAIVWRKMVHVVIDRYFSISISKIFLNPRLSLIVPLPWGLGGWVLKLDAHQPLVLQILHKRTMRAAVAPSHQKPCFNSKMAALKRVPVTINGLRDIGQYFEIFLLAEFHYHIKKLLLIYKYKKENSRNPSESEEIIIFC